jgi:superfamily II DNA helicase RecQ
LTLRLSLKVHVHNSKTKAPGKALCLIVTVKQLFKTPEGHLPRLAILVRCRDLKQISRVNVDEAHFIYTAGTALYGLNAFRPAWGRLNELKVLFPASVIWAAYSAMFPPHILKAIENKVMRPNYVYIHTSSNRPNITYAIHQVIETIEDPRNYECFLMDLENFKIDKHLHVLIFIDDTKLTEKIASHLDTCLPVQFYGLADLVVKR